MVWVCFLAEGTYWIVRIHGKVNGTMNRDILEEDLEASAWPQS